MTLDYRRVAVSLLWTTIWSVSHQLPAEDLLQPDDVFREPSAVQFQNPERPGRRIVPADFAEDELSEPPPPAPLPPAADQPAASEDTGGFSQRLFNLENEFHQFQSGLMAGTLVPGRLRSTDIHPETPTNKQPTFPNTKVTGFFQADAAWFAQDTANTAQLGNIQDDRGFRRARLAAVGDVTENVGYMIEMDFAFPGRPSFMDVWLDVHDVPWLENIRVGQWRQPFGMDELTSVRELTFLERPLGFAFAPFRQTGIGFHKTNAEQTVTYAASVYGFPTDVWGDSFGDRGYGTAERVTGLAYYECDGRHLIHLGLDHAYTNPNDAGWFYRNTPEYGGPFMGAAGNTSGIPFFVNTGTLLFDQSNLFNAELAGVWNSFHWQSEVRYAVVDIAGDTIVLPHAYVQAAYILTGEVRPYNKVAGVLGRIKPDRPWGQDGCGAWEIAARYSYINLNPAAPYGLPAGTTPGFGGELNDVTIGLNWYLNSFTKFQFNYIHANLNRDGVDSNADVVAVRAQLDF